MKRILIIWLWLNLFICLLQGESAPPAVITSIQGEITNNTDVNKITIYGTPVTDSPIYRENIFLQIENENKIIFLPPSFGGYDVIPTLHHLEEQPGKDLLLRLPSGGNGGYYSFIAYSLHRGIGKPLFSSEDLTIMKPVIAVYKKDFQMAVQTLPDKKLTYFDLKYEKEGYLNEGIYAANGSIKEKREVWITEVIDCAIEKEARKKKFTYSPAEVSFIFAVKGLYNADTVTYAKGIYQLKDGELKLIRTKLFK